MSTFITKDKKELHHNGKVFKIRYFTTHSTATGEEGELLAICDTDELQGRFGDEFPMSQVDNFKNNKLVFGGV